MINLPRLSCKSILLLLFVSGLTCINAQETNPNRNNRLRELDEQLQNLIIRNSVFNEGFTAFRLMDTESGSDLFDFRGDKFFTPASNVKLFTWYLTRAILGDSIPAIKYRKRNDTLEIWGTGYPLLLHPDFVEQDALREWLKKQELPLLLYLHQEPNRYGAGWSWDDFNDGYVYERSLLPVYGNRISLKSKAEEVGFDVVPPDLASKVTPVEGDVPSLQRGEFDNNFRAASRLYFLRDLDLQRPLHLSRELTEELLTNGLQKPLRISKNPPPSTTPWQTLKLPLPDSIYRIMLQESDNFLAEQLLLAAATERYGKADLQLLFAYARDTLLPELMLLPRQWVDGSGLSRYNQFTPRQITGLLLRAYREVGENQLKELLAAGGETGTLKSYFKAEDEPYLWAKSGSLRNVLCLSGLLETNSGRRLIFSFMHNRFPGKSRVHYREMEQVLRFVRDNF